MLARRRLIAENPLFSKFSCQISSDNFPELFLRHKPVEKRFQVSFIFYFIEIYFMICAVHRWIRLIRICSAYKEMIRITIRIQYTDRFHFWALYGFSYVIFVYKAV